MHKLFEVNMDLSTDKFDGKICILGVSYECHSKMGAISSPKMTCKAQLLSSPVLMKSIPQKANIPCFKRSMFVSRETFILGGFVIFPQVILRRQWVVRVLGKCFTHHWFPLPPYKKKRNQTFLLFPISE